MSEMVPIRRRSSKWQEWLFIREREKRRTWEEGATSHRMIADQGTLALDLRGHFLGNLRWEHVRGVQPHDWQRMQGRDFGAEQIRPDHGFRAICADEEVACGCGVVLERCRDGRVFLVGVFRYSAKPLAIL